MLSAKKSNLNITDQNIELIFRLEQKTLCEMLIMIAFIWQVSSVSIHLYDLFCPVTKRFRIKKNYSLDMYSLSRAISYVRTGIY